MAEETDATGKPTFEQAYNRLEKVARELESGETPLERAFELFEEGQKLLKMCHDLLDKAEKKLKILDVRDSEYEIREEPIDRQG